MKIAIFGTGYVGLVTGACLADVGHHVTCIDIDEQKIVDLNNGKIPIYEPGLNEIVRRNVPKGRLEFTTNFESPVKDSQIIFIAVGTPPDEDGSADLQHVLKVAEDIGKNITEYKVVVTKSTVPVGTADKVKQKILDQGVDKEKFSVASNPEFLKEGDAIQDFMKPDRIVVGVEDEYAMDLMDQLYRPFTLNGHPVIFMDIKSAEVTKYAANAMLATKISFINEIANFCDAVGADIDMVRKGITSDTRIGKKFLYPGIGWGGSCFPKDTRALIKTGNDNGKKMDILRAVDFVNDRQKSILLDKFNIVFGDRYIDGENITVGIWGLSFKPNTDDMREAPSITIINNMLVWGRIKIKVYDPVAMDNAKKMFDDAVEYCDDMYSVTKGANALMVLTEWSDFRTLDINKLKKNMKELVLFDGRNIYDKENLISNGFKYIGIGR